jgi:hypothetical protein
MGNVSTSGSMHNRTMAILNGERPDHLPFVTRLEAWYKSHTRTGTLPQRFKGMSLPQVHQAVGVGQLKFMVPYALKLRQVDVKASFEGECFYKEWEPVVENFPGMWDLVSTEKPGETVTELATPVGKLRLRHQLLPEGVLTGTDPYLKEHLIQEESDYHTVEYILEHVEYIPLYEKVYQQQCELGENAFVVPLMHRIPFQQILLEYIGEINLFFALYDSPEKIRRLNALLDQQLLEFLDEIASFESPYIEFPDNLHGLMTNPRLFGEFCLPAYQRYTEKLHQQGKKAGSHTDGDVSSLLGLLKESGLDICESFSPQPLTTCKFSQAWDAWKGHPLIWGGIPSPILEVATSEADFHSYIRNLFETIGSGSVILGVVDLFMRHNSIERVEYIADLLSEK